MTNAEQDRLWRIAVGMHPGWEFVDIRNSVDPGRYPTTAPYWDDCESGAQWADLVRFEELLRCGGVYIDSDVEVLKPFDQLLPLVGFAGYEDVNHVCIAVLGFTPGHPVVARALKFAIERRHAGTWNAGMGAFRDALIACDPMILFPPGMFYPVHYRESMPPRDRVAAENPWAYAIHYWARSWQQQTIESLKAQAIYQRAHWEG